jgi:hypothetical protein
VGSSCSGRHQRQVCDGRVVADCVASVCCLQWWGLGGPLFPTELQGFDVRAGIVLLLLLLLPACCLSAGAAHQPVQLLQHPAPSS